MAPTVFDGQVAPHAALRPLPAAETPNGQVAPQTPIGESLVRTLVNNGTRADQVENILRLSTLEQYAGTMHSVEEGRVLAEETRQIYTQARSFVFHPIDCCFIALTLKSRLHSKQMMDNYIFNINITYARVRHNESPLRHAAEMLFYLTFCMFSWSELKAESDAS